jgi:hypothetical protein
MQLTTIGIDLAKNVFQVPGVNEHGKAGLRKQLRQAKCPFPHECSDRGVGFQVCEDMGDTSWLAILIEFYGFNFLMAEVDMEHAFSLVSRTQCDRLALQGFA